MTKFSGGGGGGHSRSGGGGGGAYQISLPKCLLLSCFMTFTGVALLLLSLDGGSVDLPAQPLFQPPKHATVSNNSSSMLDTHRGRNPTNCATLEEMGLEAVASGGSRGGDSLKENLRLRRLIRDHFAFHVSARVTRTKIRTTLQHSSIAFCTTLPQFQNELMNFRLWLENLTFDAWRPYFYQKVIHFPPKLGTSRVRQLPPEQFCRQGFVMGKGSEAGFGFEMYKILTAAGLSIMLNRSLIIGKTRSVRSISAALNCISTAIMKIPYIVGRPRIVLVSDTPSLIRDITPKLLEFAEAFHFDYKKFKGNTFGREGDVEWDIGFRAKDWGPAPRWVAFVDFFLASRAKNAVISGNSFSKICFHYLNTSESSRLGARLEQICWSIELSYPIESVCSYPTSPPGWWDGKLQSPIP